LNQKGGIGVFQVITMPETRYDRYCKEVDFIRKYIFPGCHVPSVTTLVEAIAKGSKGKLIIDDIENIGPHYARTLRLWRERFLSVFDEHIHPALLKSWPNMTLNEVETFKPGSDPWEPDVVIRLLRNPNLITRDSGKHCLVFMSQHLKSVVLRGLQHTLVLPWVFKKTQGSTRVPLWLVTI
jgi:hypothetical protein